MTRKPLTKLAQEFIAEAITSGDTVIDATLGNGHDTLYLAALVGPTGKLFGFDVQQQAIAQTEKRLSLEGLEKSAQLFLQGHEQMTQWVPAEHHGRISAIMFNLGYLPGGDKAHTTLPTTTIKALDCAKELLAPGGRMTILAYIGHPGGRDEANQVEHWVNGLESGQWHYHSVQPENMKSNPPKLYCCEKLQS